MFKAGIFNELVILLTLCIVQPAHAAILELVSSVPASNAVNISRTDTLTLQFSAPLAAWSVSRTNVTLQSAGDAQKVSVNVSGAVVSIRPLTPLLPWTRYTLNATSLTGSNGEQLEAPVAISFKTRDATWQTPQTLDTLTPTQWNPVIRTNAKGVRFIVWQQTDASGTGDDIWAIQQLPGKPASAATLVASYPAYSIRELNVFIDDDGNAIASWVVGVNNGSTNAEILRLSRFVAGSGSGSGWGMPQDLDNLGSEAGLQSGTGLQLVFDHAGNALAVWARYTCCGPHELQSIIANRYTRVKGWTKATLLDDTSFAFLGGGIYLQMDDAGNAYAAWYTQISYPYVPPPTVAHYTLDVGWSAPQVIGPDQSHTQPEQLTLAVNHQGEAFLMWLDFDGLDYARADSSGNWSAPVSIDPSGTQPPISMALLDDDHAFAVFADGVKRFVPSQNLWTSTHPLFANQSVSQYATNDAQIVADASGNALVAWTQSSNDINRIFAKRYLADYGWLQPAVIDTGDTIGAGLEDLILEPDGSAVAAWWQGNDGGTTDIVTASFE